MRSKTQTAWRYFQLLNQGRTEAALDLLDDGGSFWDLRTRTETPVPEQRDRTRAALAALTLHFTLLNAVEDGDQVVLEAASTGTTADGHPYSNSYCFVLVVRDDKIVRLREYFDTRAAQELTERRDQAAQIEK